MPSYASNVAAIITRANSQSPSSAHLRQLLQSIYCQQYSMPCIQAVIMEQDGDRAAVRDSSPPHWGLRLTTGPQTPEPPARPEREGRIGRYFTQNTIDRVMLEIETVRDDYHLLLIG